MPRSNSSKKARPADKSNQGEPKTSPPSTASLSPSPSSFSPSSPSSSTSVIQSYSFLIASFGFMCIAVIMFYALHPPPPVNPKDILDEGGSYVILPDGRTLEYFTAGSPNGVPLVYFYGYGNTARRLLASPEVFTDRGFRVIAISIPGFGRSSLHPKRSLLEWPNDVIHVLEQEHVDRFYVAGYSFGGQHAAAVAHALPQRTLGLLMVAPVAPADIPFSVNSTSLITDTLRFLMSYPVIGDAVSLAVALAPLQERLEALPCYAAGLKRLAVGTAADRKLYSDILEDHRRGIVQGHRGLGPASIRLMTVEPWGFDMEDLGMLTRAGKPVVVASSSDDVVNPLAWHEWMAKKIPGATLNVYSGWGHAVGEVQMDRILDDFLAIARHPEST